MSENYTRSLDDNPEIEALVKEVGRILGGTENLNNERTRLEEIFKRITYWTSSGGYYEEFYESYKRVLTAMGDFDFSQRMPVLDAGSNFPSFIALGLNTVNEELEDSAFSVGIIHSLIKSSGLSDRVFIITDHCGKIRCIHACKETKGFDEDYLTGKHIKVVFADFNSLDQRITEEGIGKEFEVKLRNPAESVMLNVYYNSSLNRTEGIIYALRFKK